MSTLTIIRHAYAGHYGDPRYPQDNLRPLTAGGVRQFCKFAKRLVSRGLAPQMIVTSPFARCRQTAELLNEALLEQTPDARPRLVKLADLAPGSSLKTLLDWSNRQNLDWIAWVGHAPDVDHFVTKLLGATGQAVHFRKGTLATLHFPDQIAPGQGTLQCFVSPTDLGCVRRRQ